VGAEAGRNAARDDFEDASDGIAGTEHVIDFCFHFFLRGLVDGAGWNRPELAGIESELRERILGRWTGTVRRAGYDALEARTIVWAVVNAIFGLADQVERESLDVERAVALLETLVTAFTGSTGPGQRARLPSAGADALQQN